MIQPVTSFEKILKRIQLAGEYLCPSSELSRLALMGWRMRITWAWNGLMRMPQMVAIMFILSLKETQ